MGWEHVIPEFIIKMNKLADARHKVDFPIQGTGEETRSFIFIDDFLDGLMKVILKGEHLEVYHIGTTNEIKLSSLAHNIAKLFNTSINIIPNELVKGGTLRRCPDITKIIKLGFNPKFSLDESLKITKQWYTENLDKNVT